MCIISRNLSPKRSKVNIHIHLTLHIRASIKCSGGRIFSGWVELIRVQLLANRHSHTFTSLVQLLLSAFVILNILPTPQHILFNHLDFRLGKQSLLMVIWVTFQSRSLSISLNSKLTSYTLKGPWCGEKINHLDNTAFLHHIPPPSHFSYNSHLKIKTGINVMSGIF